ncbi:MAG: ATP-binding protein [Haliangium ochraceum]
MRAPSEPSDSIPSTTSPPHPLSAETHGLGDDLWETVFERAPLGMVVFDQACRVIRANLALADMLGSTPEGLVGRSLLDITHPDDRDRSEASIRRLLGRELTWVTVQQRCLRDDRQTRWGEFAIRIFWGPRGDFLNGLGIVRDITDAVRAEAALRESESEQRKIEDERTRVEAALRESLAELEHAQARLQIADRMAAMGTLAAGVAHEINNPLGFIMANLGFAQEEVTALRGPQVDLMEMDRRLAALAWALGEAQEGAARVRNIVLDLKTFSHPDAGLRAPVDVRKVIDSALNLAQGEMRGRVKFVRRFHPVPPVLGNEARLSQLFLNLIINANHSIVSAVSAARSAETDAGGTAAAHEIRLSVDRADDGRVVAEISDTGVGIAPEHLDRIFDPFFTTKPIGLGTGLGLSICHGIVRSLGGEIAVSSTPGAGSTFRILLPAANDPAIATPPTTAPARTAPNPEPTGERQVKRARILVVDDEPMMGSAIGRVLAEHDVVALTSARAALTRIVAGEHFDVILCDVMMPDLSGIELHEAVAARMPELLPRLIFVTGGAYTPDAIAFLDRVTNLRLEKPIFPMALYKAVSQILDTELATVPG